MATLSTKNPTLLDHARLFNNGKILKIANTLQQYNDILDDIVWKEANQATGHVMGILTSKPTPVFRLLNQGVVPQKPTHGQIVEGIALMENRNQIDVDLANLNGASAEYRMEQAKPMIEAFSDTLANKLVYGDSSVSPEEFNGLSTRYFSLGSTFTTSAQVIDGGGTGSDNTSIWLVCWGDEKVYGIYPKGSQAGLDFQDLGIQQVTTDSTTGARLSMYEALMKWKVGLAVADYRYIVRICNIDVSNLLTAGDGSDTSANIEKLMIRALGKLPPYAGLKPVFYMNETVQTMLAYKIYSKGSSLVSWREIKGTPVFRPNPVLHFQSVPCKRIDAIGIDEARITVATGS